MRTTNGLEKRSVLGVMSKTEQRPPVTSRVPFVCSERLQRGNCAELPRADQATSIHQNKSAQRGANCIRRPWLFSVARACVGERERRVFGWRDV